MRLCSSTALLVLTVACASTQEPTAVAATPAMAAPPSAAVSPTPPSSTNAIGVVTLPAPGVPCFSGRHVEVGTEVLVYEDGVVPVARLTGTGEGCVDEPQDRQIDETLWHRTRLTGAGAEVATMAVGVVLADGLRADENGAVDLDGDGAPESFAACASSEGVHMTAWSGSVEDGRRLWHSYVYLGYDTEPTCSEAEAAP